MAKSKRDSEAAYQARKAERKLREQAEQRQKQRNRIIAIVLGLAIVAFGLVAVPWLLDTDDRSSAEKAAAKRPVASFGVDRQAAGCAALETRKPEANWPDHVRETVEYDAAPPAGGRHHPSTLRMGRDRFYTREEAPRPESAVHDLEHGLIVAWYDASLPDAEVDVLRQAAAAAGDKGLRFVAVPWARSVFPGDQHVVLTAWGVTQRCALVSGAVIADMVAEHGDAAALPERGNPV